MYAIGIEGRVSRSTGILVYEEEGRAEIFTGPGMEWREMPIGTRSWALNHLFNAIVGHVGLDSVKELARSTTLCAVAISGIDSRYNKSELAKGMRIFGFETGDLYLGSLAEAGHLGAFLGKPGVLIRCGNGVSIYLRTDEGIIRLVSGWGRIVGDEGSAHWLGRQALAAASRVIDLRADSLEKEFVTELLKKQRLADEIDLFSQMEEARAFAGAFGVCRYLTNIGHVTVVIAEQGDTFARLLMQRAHREIIESTRTVISELATVGDRIQLCLRGGLVEGESYFCKSLVQALCREVKDIYVPESRKNGEFSPIVGTALMALGLRTREDIQKRGGGFLDLVKEHDWSKPRLCVLP